MGCSRLTKANFLDLETLPANYYSTQQTAFPVSNLYTSPRRTKVWRSGGLWLVDSSNKQIVFNEGGSDLTATLDENNYPDAGSLMAEITVALNAAGSFTYIASYNASTKKIEITASSAMVFKWADSVSAGFADMAGFSPVDSASSTTHVADAVRIHTHEYLRWDLGIPTNPQALILIDQRNEPIKISPSATLTFQATSTFSWNAPEFETPIPYDDRALSLTNKDGIITSGVPLRYMGIKIVDRDNPLGYVQLGSVFLGDFFQPTEGVVTFPLQGQYIDRSETSFSEGGQSFSDQKGKTEELTLTWDGLTKQEKEEIDAIWDRVGTSLPFFTELDPNLAFSTSAAKYIRYVKFAGQPSYTLSGANRFSVQMTLIEEI